MPTRRDKRHPFRGALKAMAAMWLGAALAADRDLKRDARRRKALAESIAPSGPGRTGREGVPDEVGDADTGVARKPLLRRGWVQLWAAMAVLGLVIVVLAGVALARGWFDEGDITGTSEGFVPTAAPVGASAAVTWPEYGFDNERTRANPALTVRPPFRETWSFDAGSLLEFPPVIADGRAIVGTNAGLGIAVDSSTGEELWRVQLRGRVASSPAIAKDLALFTTINGRFVAVQVATGKVAWRVNLGSGSESSPLVLDGDAYIGTLDGRVLRFDLESRRPVWVARATGEVKASLAQSGPNVIVGDYGGNVSAFSRQDGSLAWRTKSPSGALRGAGRFYAGPAVAYGRVYVGNINGRVLGLSARTGAISWVRIAEDWVYSSAAVANQTVFVGSYDEKLYALDAVTGVPRWTFSAGERISGSASVIGDVVYVSTIARDPKDGKTFALDVNTGPRIWQFPDGRYSPAVAVDDLLILTGVRTMYGFVPAA
jgi:outer membrane protein assembly factor BamB